MAAMHMSKEFFQKDLGPGKARCFSEHVCVIQGRIGAGLLGKKNGQRGKDQGQVEAPTSQVLNFNGAALACGEESILLGWLPRIFSYLFPEWLGNIGR